MNYCKIFFLFLSINVFCRSSALYCDRNFHNTIVKHSIVVPSKLINPIRKHREISTLKSRLDPNFQSQSKSISAIAKHFIPGFIGVWAIGYTIIATVEVGGPGLGDLGGIIGTSFVLVLMIALFGAILYEVIKPENDENLSS